MTASDPVTAHGWTVEPSNHDDDPDRLAWIGSDADDFRHATMIPDSLARCIEDAALLTEARTLLAHALEEAGDCPLCDGHGTYPTPINCGPDDTPDPCPLCAVYELLLAPDGTP